MEAPREKEGPSRVPWNIRGIEHPLVKPVHQSLLVGKCRAASLHGSWRGKKASRANYLRFPYGFNFSSSFEDLRRIGWILFGWRFGGKREIRWISFCRDRWNNRKSADLERLSWINFRTIGWIYNSIETCNAKSGLTIRSVN